MRDEEKEAKQGQRANEPAQWASVYELIGPESLGRGLDLWAK